MPDESIVTATLICIFAHFETNITWWKIIIWGDLKILHIIFHRCTGKIFIPRQ